MNANDYFLVLCTVMWFIVLTNPAGSYTYIHIYCHTAHTNVYVWPPFLLERLRGYEVNSVYSVKVNMHIYI